ncbi:MAG: InlB B-repeat-containing protein [Alphaproteobacteria bacterium]|nr:InlB B-repeat-containing protein [Alphaproteobacteria bacterium]
MEKKRSFLGFLASLFIVFFTANAFAEGYTCDDIKKYTSCNANYYLNGTDVGNACVACASGYTKAADSNVGAQYCTQECTVNCTQQTCPANATCIHGSETNTGTRNQTQAAGVCSATQPTCSIDISCNASYYKNGSTCTSCGTGYYSAKGATSCTACTNKPANSSYTGNASSNSCPWSCNANYTKNAAGTACTPNSYTISYTLNSGTNAPSGMPTSYTYGVGTTINGVPTRAGYTFAGWCTNSALTSCSMTQTIPTTATGNKTFYAKWTQCTACSATNANCTLSVQNNVCTYTTTCKASYYNLQNNGKYNPSCSSCPTGTYTVNGNTATTCSTCTNTKPANSSYSGNATSNACPWSCNTGYHKNDAGTACVADCSTSRACSADFSGYTGTYNQCEQNQSSKCTKLCSGDNTSACPSNADCVYNNLYSYYYPNSGTCPVSSFSCKANYYKNGTACTGCQSGYTSPAGSTSSTQCTKSCDAPCSGNDTANCPSNASCTYNTAETYPGTQVQGGSCTADVSSTVCPRTGFSCNSGYYKDTDNSCAKTPEGGKPCADGSIGLCCEAGYTKSADGRSCNPNTYRVTYSCGDGAGTVPTSNTATYNASYTPKSNTCTREEYAFDGWLISGTSEKKAAGANFIWPYTENKTFTAQWIATACPANEYLDGTVCKTCPGTHPSSDAGDNTGINKCYATCPTACKTPADCPEHAITCPVISSTVEGKRYYGEASGVCNTTEECAFDGTKLRCESTYYNTYYSINDDGELVSGGAATCNSCSAIPDVPAGTYPLGGAGIGKRSGPNSCYASCNDYVCPTLTAGSDVKCPLHAKSCTPVHEMIDGYKPYPETQCQEFTSECTYTIVCEDGYELNTSTGTCDAITVTVTLNRNYEASDNTTVATIYQQYATGWYSDSAATNLLAKAAVPTRANYNFMGYYTARTGGTQIIKADGTLPVSTTYSTKASVTLYAQWNMNSVDCQVGKYYDGSAHVDCPAGMYCNGNGTSPIGTAGCGTSCPADTANGTVSSPKNSSAVTACETTRTNQALADGTGKYTQRCLYNATQNTYSASCEVVNVTACNAGYYLANSTDKTCTGVPRGEYSIADELAKHSCQGLSGATAATTTAADKAGTPTLCYNTCQAKTIDNGQLIPTNTQEFFNGTTIPACTYTPKCDPSYTPNATKTQCIWADPNKCPAGYYCEPGTPEPIECPDGGTSDTGATSVEQCYKVYDPYSEFKNGTGSAVCYYLPTAQTANKYSKCQNIQAKTCNAGYYYRDIGATTCIPVVSGSYSPEGPLGQTACPVGGNGSTEFAANWDACYKNCEITVEHSSTVAAKENTVFGTSANSYAACSFHVTCNTGYSPNNNDTATPTCDANRYTVTLDKNGGEGSVANSIECTFDSGACTLPATSGLTRAGYSAVAKWCTTQDGSGICYNAGTTVTSNISATGSAITLYAAWTPNVYQITLKHVDATVAGAPATAYLKYATGWFADADAALPLSQLSKAPEKSGYEFAGYKSANNTIIVDANGMFQTTEAALTFTTSATDITVVWSAGNTKCDAGTYYQGTGSTCLPCSDNHYCPGGSFATDGGQAGLNECRDNGKTAAGAQASSETQCFKEDLPTYVATHGTGTQKCYFDAEKLAYSAECTDKFITACEAGYWQANKSPVQTAPDCVEVDNGYYSAENDTERTACPAGGTTAEKTAATVQRCYKSGMDYTAEFGTGTQRCYYSSGEGTAAIYNRDCDTKVITKCRGGYWLDVDTTDIDCSPVGYDHYSETDDTARHACEGGGKTNSEITSSPLACYKDSEVYTAAHGGGYRTCYYTSGTGANALYETSCETPTLTYCNGGYYADVTINTDDCIEVGYGFWSPAPTPSHLADSLDRTSCGEGETTATPTSESPSACYTCPAGQICDPDSPNKPQTCADATKGSHPNSDAGNTEVAGCWRECAVATNAATMKGHDYYGRPDTCEIDRCKSGYTYNASTKACEICPEGTFCGGGDDNCPAGQNCDAPKSCAELGDGSWKFSDVGATGPASCYLKCEAYPLEGGTAIPVNERAYYANKCEYKGVDEEGNPCDIDNGACLTTSCKPSYEMIGGRCVACNRDHALSYKTTGNCMVESCEPGWHPYGQSCESDITECSAPNALRAEKQWDYKKNSYGICMIKECEDGFHISSNACVADIQECTVEHGIGEKEWNHITNTWGDCVATSCDPGFTNDPYETNEPTKQCGHCKNKFGVKGELAASSYSRGCTISACMYQGEMYNLENNECNPICDVNGYEDETGTMKWNPVTHKCDRKCKEGYVMW